jgi:hypothetical protein
MADRDPNRPINPAGGGYPSRLPLGLVFLVPVFLLQMMGHGRRARTSSTRSSARSWARGNVGAVVFIEGRTIEGELRDADRGRAGPGHPVQDRTAGPRLRGLVTELEAAGVNIGARKADRDWWAVV